MSETRETSETGETYGRLVDLLVDRFEVDRAEVAPDTRFEDLDMDSLFLVELLLVIQSEFKVDIGEDAATPGDTVAAVAALIEGRRPLTSPGAGTASITGDRA
ncbi:acyl carrier protein [Streptomyces aureocirculatus]|uniref:acyl carrier protein n=1 Tax=Streptomyces aureocirculatus TaxID=67275 RepID=UPI0004CB5989|nr:phosphopantetheine-binding protein [Streptomyces aureocirculatus]